MSLKRSSKFKRGSNTNICILSENRIWFIFPTMLTFGRQHGIKVNFAWSREENAQALKDITTFE